MPAVLPIVGLAGSIGGALISSNAAGNAAEQQTDAANAGIAVQNEQFNRIQELLAPFVSGGTSALGGMLDIVGLNGPEAEATAIANLENSPEFTAYLQQGEEAILQNASATGGLRGGNTQGALLQYRPRMLADHIDRQYGRLNDISRIGLGAATGTGNAGQANADAVSRLYGEAGAAGAGASLARGQAWGNVAGDVGQTLGGIDWGAIFANGGTTGGQTPYSGIPPGNSGNGGWGII